MEIKRERLPILVEPDLTFNVGLLTAINSHALLFPLLPYRETS